ncbi:YxiG family protein [Bacillus xiamenensis]|uniref:YxiG family protein n=1 Tax=Bacillus TaxID=1386 RepID=UPI0009F31A7F
MSFLISWISISYHPHPHGIGNLKNKQLEEFDSHANFIFNIDCMLFAIESKKVCFDSQEFICSV